jgi:hypothetical protein
MFPTPLVARKELPATQPFPEYLKATPPLRRKYHRSIKTAPVTVPTTCERLSAATAAAKEEFFCGG